MTEKGAYPGALFALGVFAPERILFAGVSEMRFWFLHSGEVPVREQIVTQVILGILSDELSPGERLPSTRELGRRFQLHANTVSGAYRQLESEGWVESRRGSGVFVRATRPALKSSIQSNLPEQLLDRIFSNFLHSARRMKIPMADVRQRIRQWIDAPQPSQFVLVEPDSSLRRIVINELHSALLLPILESSLDDADLNTKLRRSIPLVLPSKAAALRQLAPAETEIIVLQVRSAAASLAKWLPAPSDALIGIASAWPQFLDNARTMLIASGFSNDALLVRNASVANWSSGLDQTSAVVCDTLTATMLPTNIRSIPFALLTEATVENLRERSLSLVPSEICTEASQGTARTRS